jgi:hypothetical protein
MPTYQGPHASVRQKFVTSPAAAAIDNLPPAIVATAFDVYAKELLGTHYGIVDQQIAWVGNNSANVVWNKDVIDQRAFDFYPAKAFTDSVLNQDPVDLELELTKIALAGVTIDRDKSFSVPGVAKGEGVSEAIIPYYRNIAKELVSAKTSDGATAGATLQDTSENFDGTVSIGDLVINTTGASEASARVLTVSGDTITVDASIFTIGDTYRIVKPIKNSTGSLQILEIPNGNIGRVKPGQNVFLKAYDIDAGWSKIGVVASTGGDPTRLTISGYGTTQVAGGELVIGAALKDDGTVDATLLNYPNTLWDDNGAFETNNVERGDILEFSSLSLSNSTTTPRKASIVNVVSNNMVFFNTQDLTIGSTVGKIDYDFARYEYNDDAPGSTVNVSSYDIKRLVGFSQNHGLKHIGTGIQVTKESASSFSILNSENAPLLASGDIFMITTANPSASADERDTASILLYRISTVDVSPATKTTYTCDEVIKNTTTQVEYLDATYISAWTPSAGNGRELNILADYRSFRDEEAGVVKRITQQKDIFDNFVRTDEEAIDPRNELAFMLDIAFQLAGGRPVYGINVDQNGYTDALEELKLYDVYSHAFGSTGLGVTEIGAYCDQQSEPYEGHERIAHLCYDELDVYNMGSDSGSMTNGTITISGTTFNPLTAGLTVKDKVRVLDSSNNFEEEVTVTATPTTTTTIETDGEIDYASGHKFQFQIGRKAAQANAAGSIAGGNRRIKNTWPGWFTAEWNSEVLTLPPYFFTAARAGMDSSQIVSQSLTNMPFTIPNLSNFTINTDTYFNKIQLDSIAQGGIDIIVKSGTALKSRHDLTSDMSSVQFREASITKQADLCAKTIRTAVAPYVGRYNIGSELFRFLGQIISVASTKLVKEGIISSLTTDSIERDEEVDDKINIYMNAIAFIAGNYFDITLLVRTR